MVARSYLARLVLVLSSLPLFVHSQDDSEPRSIGPKGTMVVTNKDVSPDGFTRSAVVAGDTVPGIPIIGNKGDRFEITVDNQLSDTTMLRQTAIHWHGISHRPETIWADGAAGITQCPIAQNHSFTYIFNSDGQAGTFWYHSHFGNQYCDGLRGPLVIYDKEDPLAKMYDVDDVNTILTLGEWYHAVSPQVVLPPNPDATLFNGKGRSIGGPQSDLFVLTVEQGKRYRIRLISTSCEPFHKFKIDGHDFVVIEADGHSVWPVKADALDMYPGQRYSIVLHANRERDNYWIRANPNLGATDTYENGVNSAILRYKGASDSEPETTEDEPKNYLAEADLHPFYPDFPGGSPWRKGADYSIDLELELDEEVVPPVFKVNGVPFRTPTVPVLLQLLSGAKQPEDLVPSGSVHAIEKGWTIEVAMEGGSPASPHPFHLHGHSFQVIKSAGSMAYNYINPVRRDVVALGMNNTEEDLVVVRFKADRTGPFIFHCHADWHLNLGMGMMFTENSREVNDTKPTTDWDELCPIFDDLTEEETEITQ